MNIVFIQELRERSPKTYKRILSKLKSEELDTFIIEYTSFLGSEASRSQRLFHVAEMTQNVPLCPICGVLLRFKDFSSGYTKFCSGSCEIKNKWRKITPKKKDELYKKQRSTNFEKYGDECSFRSETVKRNIKNSFTQKYGDGITNPSQVPEIRERANNSIFNTHGVRNAGQTQNAIQARIDKFGVENPFSCEDIQRKIRETNFHRYNAEYPMQCPAIFDKAIKHRSYKYLASNGKEYVLQGYEKYALEDLLKRYEENDIIHGASEIRKYVKFQYTLNNKLRNYFPDFYVISENLVVEVKSAFTLKYEKEKNDLKRESVLKSGVNFQFWVYDKNGELSVKRFTISYDYSRIVEDVNAEILNPRT